MKSIIISALALGGVFAVPAVTSAATFQYVSATGWVSSLEAVDAAAALQITASLAPHSGVIMVTPSTMLPAIYVGN